MSGTGRPRSVIAHPQQWAHCLHDATSLLPGGGIELGWTPMPGPVVGADCPPRAPGGLVFDPWCVGYRSEPATGAVVAVQPGRSATTGCPGAYARPAGLAIDAARRLYVADPGAREVVVVDLDQRRVLARVAIAPDRPLDLSADCGRALLLTESGRLIRLEGRRPPRPGPRLVAPRCPAGLAPARITAGPVVLWTTPDGELSVLADLDGTVLVESGAASDVDRSATGRLVLAGRPGEPFRRFEQDSTGWVELEPVGCPGYDGGAIAHTPAGRITYTTATGIATTTGPQTRHHSTGTVTSFRLDSGAYGTRWGRIFLEACLPPRTRVALRFLTTDEDEVLDPLQPRAADDAYPPLPSAAALAADVEQHPEPRAVFRRRAGAEHSWSSDSDFASYEAPVHARRGRYLWFQLTLSGTDQLSPRIRAVRVERPGHPLLTSLPLAWSRVEADADFLQRYLAPVDGVLDDLDWRSAQRAILVDPRAVPADKLAWLASFAGLVVDQRWPEPARRALVAEAFPLYARRGTAAALLRMVELYLGRAPELIETWQLRGLGGAVLGIDLDGPLAPRVEGSARATGSLGRFAVGGDDVDDATAFRATAHRATILVPGTLAAEQREVLAELLETHRPAHVVLDVCELGTGMRVGTRLRVSLTSFVGPGGRWRSVVLGEAGLGGAGLAGLGLGDGGVVGDGSLADGWRVGEVGVGCRRVR